MQSGRLGFFPYHRPTSPPLILGEIHTNIQSRAVLLICYQFYLRPAPTGRYPGYGDVRKVQVLF